MAEQSTQKANPWMMSTLVLVGLMAGFGIAQIPYFGGGAAAVISATTPEPATRQEAPMPTKLTDEQTEALTDDDIVFGDEDAEVTIVEFSDFQCTFCARFFATTLPSVERNYIDTGKVKLVYRDFPLENIHPQAMQAAQAAECAREEDKFREMHDVLFNKQSEWSGNPTFVEMVKGYAVDIGLNQSKFDSCLDEGKYAMEVRKDLLDGAAVGINGTPGFFINGKLVSGAMPYEEVFKPILDAELEGDNWKLVENPATGAVSVEVL